MNFDSGWEWGYWLNDVITARASWDPQLLDSTNNASDNTHNDVDNDEWQAFTLALRPITHGIFGDVFGPQIAAIMVKLTQFQAELLIRGSVNGSSNPNINKLR
jgi:hypothetical protein